MEPSDAFGNGLVSVVALMIVTIIAYILDVIFGDDTGDVCGDMRDRKDDE